MIGPWFINWNDYKATFEAEAEKIVGRPVRVIGSASAALLPSPSLTFEDVAVGDVGGEPMMTVDRFEVTIELMPLLQGHFQITSMRLARPSMRVVVGDDGRLDWQARNKASQALDPEKVILDRLEIVDGHIDYNDRVGETELSFEGVNAVVEARSMLGPWRIEGSYLQDGVAVPFRFATGRRLDDGTIRLKTDISPAGWRVALLADGLLGSDEGGLFYDGTFNLTEIAETGPPAGENEEPGEAVYGWRSEGKFRLTRRQLAVAQAVLSQGPPDRPFSVAGSLAVELGAKPSFEARASARQIDLDRALGSGPAKPVEVSEAFGSLVASLQDSFVPPIPGNVFVRVPGIVLGGAVIQNVAFEVRPTIGGWRIASLEANLPGRALLEARGVLATDFEVGFAGNIRLAVDQPALFAKWWRGGDQGDAGRLLAQFDVAARAELAPGRLLFEEIDAVFGGAAVRGKFAWSETAARQYQRVVEAELLADSIDFVQLRSFVELVGGSDLAGTTVLADSYDIKLATDAFQFEDISLRDVAVDASYADDTLTVNQFGVGDLGGAQISVTQGQIRGLTGQPQGHLDARLEAGSLDGFTRVVERLMPDHAVTRWLKDAGPSLSPAFLSARIEAPARDDTGDIRASLTGTVASTNVSTSIDMTGSLAEWQESETGIRIVVDSPDAGELARQAGISIVEAGESGGVHLEIDATGVPMRGLSGRVAGDFAGVKLRSEGRLALPAEGLPQYVGSLAVASDDIEPIFRVFGLDIPGAAIDNSIRIDGDLEISNSAAEITLRNSQVSDRLLAGALSLTKVNDDAWALGGDLHIDAVDLDWISALALGFALQPTDDPAAPWSRTPFAGIGYGNVSGRLAVSADTLAVIPGFDANAATLALSLQPNRLAVDVEGAKAVGGSMAGGVSVHNVDGNARVTGRIELKDAALEDLIWWRGGRAVATGVIDLSAEFEAAGRSPAALASSLTGGGALSVRDGEIRYMNPRAARLVIRASDLGQEFTENELRQALTRQIDGGSFTFDHAEGAFATAAGVVRLKGLAIDGSDLDASGDAVIDLNRLTIDSDWTVTFEAGDDQVEGTVPQAGIVFRGPVDAPERIIDVLQFGSYLNIRREARLLELLSQAEADRLEADRLNREKRKLREDAERRARRAAEAEAARIAALAEERRLVAEAAARLAAGEAERFAGEAEQRRVAVERAERNLVAAEAASKAAAEQASQAATEAGELAQRAGQAWAAARDAADARNAAEQAAEKARVREAEAKAAADDAAITVSEAEAQFRAARLYAQQASDAVAASRRAEERAVAAAVATEAQRGDAEEAIAAANSELSSAIATEEEARKTAFDVEGRARAAQAAAAEGADRTMALIGAEEAAQATAVEAATDAAEASRQLAEARQAVAAARQAVAEADAAKQAANAEADRVLAEATDKLRGPAAGPEGAPGGDTIAGLIGSEVTEEEAARLRATVARAIQTANEANGAFLTAEDALISAEERLAQFEAAAERLQAAAAAASRRASEALAAREAAAEGARTAELNADALIRGTDEALQRADAAAATRQAAEAEVARLNAEAARLSVVADAAADEVVKVKAARVSAETALADANSKAANLGLAADQLAKAANDATAAHSSTAVETAQLTEKAERWAVAAREATDAAEEAEVAVKVGEREAERLAAVAEQLRIAAAEAVRLVEHARAALAAAEAEAARIAAEAEHQRLVAEEATREALEVAVPQ